jgi:PPM family protein phosphatase
VAAGTSDDGATAQATERIESFGLTDVGKVRKNNEDQFLIARARKSLRIDQTSLTDLSPFDRLQTSGAHIFVVADGVGGLVGGELASGAAVEALAEHIGETIGCFYSLDVEAEHDFLDRLQGAVERSHERVLKQYASEGKGPATTLTMVTLMWPRAYVVHVGDSRVYYLRGGRLRQITRDQTAAEDLVDRGLMTEEQARKTGLKNVLTSAVGSGELTPSIGLVDLEPGDVLLLCTDGLTKHVSDDGISAILMRGESAEDMARQLVRAAIAEGGTDNVTVIVGRMLS